jgi:hypothetical protein
VLEIFWEKCHCRGGSRSSGSDPFAHDRQREPVPSRLAPWAGGSCKQIGLIALQAVALTDTIEDTHFWQNHPDLDGSRNGDGRGCIRAFKQALAKLGADPVPPGKVTAESLRSFLEPETDKWGPIIKKAGSSTPIKFAHRRG